MENAVCKRTWLILMSSSKLQLFFQEEMNRGKPNWEHLDDELHVLVQCEDTPNRAYTKLKAAVEQIKKLLIPSVYHLNFEPICRIL